MSKPTSEILYERLMHVPIPPGMNVTVGGRVAMAECFLRAACVSAHISYDPVLLADLMDKIVEKIKEEVTT